MAQSHPTPRQPFKQTWSAYILHQSLQLEKINTEQGTITGHPQRQTHKDVDTGLITEDPRGREEPTPHSTRLGYDELKHC